MEIAFPLRSQTRYHYRDNFMEPREGAPDDYNHARIHKDGSVVRLHDGTDLYADAGQPLIATFSGTVIDPHRRWRPWEADTYGHTVAIVSDEPETAGYTALYVHADHVWVAPGDHVQRGQILGTVGRTGNADARTYPATSTSSCARLSCSTGRRWARAGRSMPSTRSPHWWQQTPSATRGRPRSRHSYVSAQHRTFVSVACRVGFSTLRS